FQFCSLFFQSQPLPEQFTNSPKGIRMIDYPSGLTVGVRRAIPVLHTFRHRQGTGNSNPSIFPARHRMRREGLTIAARSSGHLLTPWDERMATCAAGRV